jgi:hypothetical protein
LPRTCSRARRRCGRSDIRGRAIAALASGEAPFSQTAARQHDTSKNATGKALAALAQAGDIAQDPTAATGWMIIDPLMHEWLRRRARD